MAVAQRVTEPKRTPSISGMELALMRVPTAARRFPTMMVPRTPYHMPKFCQMAPERPLFQIRLGVAIMEPPLIRVEATTMPTTQPVMDLPPE